MKSVLKILAAAIVLAAFCGCSKDDASSLKIEYSYDTHGGQTIYIIPYTGDNQNYFKPIYETKLSEYKSSLVIELNPGDYILRGSNIVETGFQIHSAKQTRAIISERNDVTIKY